MSPKFIQWLMAMALSCLASSALATLTCTIPTSTGFSTIYSNTGVVPNVTQGSVTFSCTRSATTDPTAIMLTANGGLNHCGGSNGATLGGACIQYEAYQDSACSVLWTKNNTGIPVTLASILTAQNITTQWWGCIKTAGQGTTAGIYTDLVTMSVQATNGNTTYSLNGTFPVSIYFLASCTITNIQPVNFGTYVAFQNTPLSSLPAQVTTNCTSGMPYSMALDATSGVVVGLNYSLATSWVAGSQLLGTGAGPGPTYTITGTMPAGQAGQCPTGSCSGSNTHILTVTY